MKKVNYVFRLGLASFLFGTSLAQAQTSKSSLVTITGNLDPAYTVEMSEDDRIALAKGLTVINNMPTISVDVNSIYSEKDKPAFQAASKEVSRVILEAAKKLVDMRAIVYKLDISLQQDSEHHFTTNIYSAYNKKFQNSFNELLQLFLGVDGNYNLGLTNAMESCFTTNCVQDIATAQLDMVEFGKSLNKRIDLSSTKRWEYKHGGFKSRILKDAIRQTVDEALKTNQEQSSYIQMLRAATLPFVAAATGVNLALENVADFIHSQKTSRYQLYANPLDRSGKKWDEIQSAFEARMAENYELILEKNSGAKQFKNESPFESTSQTTQLPEETKKKLMELDQEMQSLNQINALDEEGAILIIKKFINSNEAGYNALIQQSIEDYVKKAIASNLTTGIAFRNESVKFFKLVKPFAGLNTLYTYNTYGISLEINGWNGEYKINSDLKFIDSNTVSLKNFIIPSDSGSTRMFPFYSEIESSISFAIFFNDFYKNYLIKNENGQYSVNMNPKRPLVEFIRLKQ